MQTIPRRGFEPASPPSAKGRTPTPVVTIFACLGGWDCSHKPTPPASGVGIFSVVKMSGRQFTRFVRWLPIWAASGCGFLPSRAQGRASFDGDDEDPLTNRSDSL